MRRNEKKRRLEYLKKKGFEFDIHKQMWSKEDKIIENIIVENHYLTYGAFKRVVDRVDKYGNVSFDTSYVTFSRENTETSKSNKSTDAIFYRLPGSFGTGKRR